jgi:hypothetical protein
VVEHGDAAGELVSLLQVLRGEEDGDAVIGDQGADDLPHGAAAARVESGGGLVEEDDARVSHQRHGEVQLAPHAAGEGDDGLGGRLAQLEAAQQLGGPPAALSARQVVQVRHEDEVLLGGEQVVHRRELAGDADRGAHALAVAGQVVPGDPGLAGVGRDEGGEDLHGGGLARPVRTEEGEDRALRDAQVDAVKHHLLAVGLGQPDGGDRRRGGRERGRGLGNHGDRRGHGCHVPSVGWLVRGAAARGGG